jgi:hypothetical protein
VTIARLSARRRDATLRRLLERECERAAGGAHRGGVALVYDYDVLGDSQVPEDVVKTIAVPTPVMNGGDGVRGRVAVSS